MLIFEQKYDAIILDFDGLDQNYLTPFVAQTSTRELILDMNKGFKTRINSFEEVPGLFDILSQIDKQQREENNKLKNKGLEFALSLVGKSPVDLEFEGLYQLLDSKLYETRYD